MGRSKLKPLMLVAFAVSLIVGTSLPVAPAAAQPQTTTDKKSVTVTPGRATKITLAGATLDLGPDAVKQPTTITIETLTQDAMTTLDRGMSNATLGPQRGYRFLPHNTRFAAKIQVRLPYDKALIPSGFTEQDLFTYFFDDQLGTWQILDRVAVDTQASVVVSVTDHFTDVINAIVVAPDHPEAQALNPNSISDIKAANPSAAITLIQPPVVSHTGNAQLAFPIEVPVGRGGMQPDLSIGYSSSGGNGWLGAGWELSVPAVTIDTRWGVPRYDANLETETYQLNGHQLAPVAHRETPQPRSADKVFRPRVETQFERTIRHGTGPSNYWWEVTDKEGVHSYFGGTPATGADPKATLRDDAGNVFRWALAETRDTNGNGMRYAYDLVSDVGIAGGTVPGRQLYLKSVNYTQTDGNPGAYSVAFHRDSQLPGYARRPDVQIDARGGFKQVTAELLKQVDVTFNSQPVRSYDLTYAAGAFGKTLLKSITQRGTDGTALPPHEFTYFQEPQGFAQPETWDTGNDSVDWKTKTGSPADKLVGPLGEFLGFGGATALSGSVSDSVGGHLYVGFNPSAPTKQGSAGGKVGFNFSDSDSILVLLDLDGDNLPDKVFKNRDGAPYFRLNRSGPNGTTTFGPPVALPTLPAISQEGSMTWSFGAEAYFAVNGLVNDAETFTTGTVYFNDVNGDGLPDMVAGGTVLFNHLKNGVPTFTPNSADTEVPIGQLDVDPTGIVDDLTPVYEAAIDNFPLVDTVRRWVAPYAGTVAISGSFNLVQDTSPARPQYRTADGARVAIQKNGAELFVQAVPGNDYAPKTPTGVDCVSVNPGDRIYFRVGSVFDGKYDRVAWDPVVQYRTGCPGQLLSRADVNGLDDYKYQASQNFTLGGRRDISVQVPFSGMLQMTGALHKRGATTDSVTLQVIKNGTTVFSDEKGASYTGDFGLPSSLDVAKGDVIKLRLQVDSPIDVGQLQWNPRLFYTAVSDPAGTPVKDSQGNYLIQLDPPYDIDLYPASDLTAPQDGYVVEHDGVLNITTQLVGVDSQANGSVTFTIKKKGALRAKASLAVTNGVVANQSLSIGVSKGEVLFFDYSAIDPNLAAKLTNKKVIAWHSVTGSDAQFTVPSAFHSATPIGLFPQAYRGWGVAGYNGNRARASQPIDENDLNIHFDSQSSYDPRTAKAYHFYPVPSRGVWQGPDDLTFAGADASSSSRLGIDHISVPTPGTVGGAQAVTRLTRTSQQAIGFGASAGPLSATGSMAKGTNHNQLDSLDINGDGFPDIVGNGRIQFTTALGGLEARNQAVTGIGKIRGGENSSKNVGVGGSAAWSVAGASGEVDTTGNEAPREQQTGSQMVTLGLTGSLGLGTSSEKFDLIDVNGDSLPDRVARAGEGLNCGAPLCAALNLGYRFADYEPWGDVPVADGASQNFSLAGSIGFNGGIYDFAGGLSLDKNISQAGCASVAVSGVCANPAPQLLDLNGDGLTDRVRDNGNTLRVAFNTGNGFGPDATWSDALGDGTAKTGGTGLGGGAYFTIGIPTCLLACYIVINPGADVSRGLSRTEAAIRDVDGDGYPDHLTSSGDGTLKVARSRIGRTNMLQAVKRPLGAIIALDYERAGNTRDMPQSRWVLASVTVDDGVHGDGADHQLSTFRHANGQYDRLEREFYGFGSVVEEHRDTSNGGALYRTAEHEFRTDSFYTQGLLSRRTTRDGAGRPFTELQNTYRFREAGAAPGTEPADPTPLLRSTVLAVFPQLARSDERFYEGQSTPKKSSHETHDYDLVGNVSRLFQSGDDQSADDDVLSTVEYTECHATHIVGVPRKIVVTAPGGTILRHRESNIDCTTGDMTQLREYVTASDVAVSELRYFPNGNLREIVGPSNINGDHFKLEYDYDPDVQTHVARITDSFGYTSSTTYDPKFGRALRTTDISNNATTYTYDAFGRTATATGPYEQGGPIPTIRFAYHPEAAVPWALSRNFDRYRDASGSDTIDTAIFIDGLSRVLQTKVDATLHTDPGGTPQDVMRVSGRLTFDAFGRTIEQRYPVTEPVGTPGAFNPSVDGVAPTRTQLDVLDRTAKLTIPDGTATTNTYGFGADRAGRTQFLTTVVDANGVREESFRDARQLLTSIKRLNNGGSQAIWTSYRYDPLRQLVEVRDDHDNVTRLTYDNLGRRTAIESPDSGKAESVYDLASNLVARITPNLRASGKQITLGYDFTRLRSITYPTFSGNNVTYTYGGPGAPDNGAGRVTRVTDQSGSEERFYGKLGETTRETKTIVGFTGASPATFTTAYEYDAFGRLQKLTYPDGEVLTYKYDAGGLVRQGTGQKGGFSYPYANRIEYDKFGERAFVESGNGVQTRFTHDPNNRRLTSLRSARPASAPFQDLRYTYDKVGNVTALANEVPVPAPSQFGGPVREVFAYDDLYRLVNSTGTYQFAPGKTNRYSMEVSYDTIDNILRKTQTNDIVQSSGAVIPQHKTTYDFEYTYQAPRPHAATHIDNRTFTYDADGNQAGWTHDLNGTRRANVWDEEGRPQSIIDNGHELTYKYDDKGERVVKRGPQGETAYVNQYFTIRNGTIATKHVYADATRLASKLVKSNTQEKDQYFYHPDHLGSSNHITDANGALYEHLEYFPSGETWVEEASNTQRTPYLFSGKELDEETGLYYFGARYYDPRTSQFTATDPLLQSNPHKLAATPENLALYSYARNNPLLYIDPDGRDAIIAVGHDGNVTRRGILRATADRLKRNLEADPSLKGVKIHVVMVDGVNAKAKEIKDAKRKVSTVIYVGHGREGYMRPGGNRDMTVGDLADDAQLDANGCVMAVACNVLDRLDSSGLQSRPGVKVYASRGFAYFGPEGHLNTSTEDTQDRRRMAEIAGNHEPGELRLTGAAGRGREDTYTEAHYSDGGPSPLSIARKVWEAEKRVNSAAQPPAPVQQKAKTRGK